MYFANKWNVFLIAIFMKYLTGLPKIGPDSEEKGQGGQALLIR